MSSSSVPISGLGYPVQLKASTIETEFDNILDTFFTKDLADCLNILKERPSVLSKSGWNGYTILHKCALRGDLALVKAVVLAGADVERATDGGETPLMLACRRGLIEPVHFLITAGASLRVADALGRSLQHYATTGGDVSLLHYLVKIQSVSMDVVDRAGQTPLHMAAMMGNIDAVKYLLRNQLCRVEAEDVQGVTALHLAANRGFDHICWLLLCAAPRALLDQPDRSGLTPLGMLASNNLVHVDAKACFHSLARSRWWSPRHRPVDRRPRLLYLGQWVAVPGAYLVFLTAALLLAQPLGVGVGPVLAVGLAVIFCALCRQNHRLRHPSRYPNPVFAGWYVGGVFGSLLTFYAAVLPTLITRHVYLCAVLLCLTPLFVYVYLHILLVDAGVARENGLKADNTPYDCLDIAEGRVKQSSLCTYCEIIPSGHVKHCRLCERCYHDLDHHCLFLMRCITFRNNRRFMFLLFLSSLSSCFYIASYILLVRISSENFHQQYGWKEFVIDQFINSGHLLTMAFLNVLAAFWTISTFITNLNVIALGSTTYYSKKFGQSRRKFGMAEKLRNIVGFFAGERPDCYRTPERLGVIHNA